MQVSSSTWIPKYDELSQISQLLQALQNPRRADHHQAINSLDLYTQNPSFVLNLIFVFGYGNQVDESMGLTQELRQLSGFVMKNYVFRYLQGFNEEVQVSVKQGLLLACKDSISVIRNTASILLGRIVESYPTEFWANDILPELLVRIDRTNSNSQDNYAIDGAIYAIKMICEDSPEKLSMDITRRPLDVLVPRLLGLLSYPDAKTQIRAIESMNSMLFLVAPSATVGHGGRIASSSTAQASDAILLHMQTFLQGISLLANDSNPGIRRVVCQSIVLLSSMHLAVLEPIYDSVCQFMIQAVLDNEDTVSCEACEFWYTMAINVKDQIAPDTAVVKYFDTLIPNLISRMVLTEEKIIQDRFDEEAEASGEKHLNIKPIFSSHNHSSSVRKEENEESMEEDELSEQQTIRKKSAVVLETVAMIFSSAEVLKYSLPIIQWKLSSNDPWQKENGLLALGALSKGCFKALSSETLNFLPYLLLSIQENSNPPELRSIACWVLSRYAGWCFEESQLDSGIGKEWYVKALESLLQAMMDSKPKVQASACSALSSLFDEANDPDYILPYLHHIFEMFHKVFPLYGYKSKALLMDVISVIADIVGEEGMNNSSLTPFYLPYLFQLFSSTENNSLFLYPILECLVSIIGIIGLESQPYILSIYQRCIQLLTNAMTMTINDGNKPTPSHEPPPKELAICSLDLLGSISSAYKENFSLLIESSQTGGINTLFTVLFSCLHDPLPPLRQAGFSVLGELYKHGLITWIIDEQTRGISLELIQQNLLMEYPLVFNNSIWSFGEFIQRVGSYDRNLIHGYIQMYLPRISHAMIFAMHDYECEEILLQNLAITWGILCQFLPDYLSSNELIDEIFSDWCRLLPRLALSHERDHAYRGLITILHYKPSLLTTSTHVTAFIDACISWSEPPDDDLRYPLRDILESIRNNELTASTWRISMQTLSKEQKATFFDNFQLNSL